MGSFEVDDPRGEFWLYRGEGRVVSIAVGGMNGVLLETSGPTLSSGPALGMPARMEILTEALVFFGGPSDAPCRVTLEISPKFIPTPGQLARVDQTLVDEGYERREGALDARSGRLVWERKAGAKPTGSI